jgi:hypothetical protein
VLVLEMLRRVGSFSKRALVVVVVMVVFGAVVMVGGIAVGVVVVVSCIFLLRFFVVDGTRIVFALSIASAR